MPTRYDNTQIVKQDKQEGIQKMLQQRNIKSINHYTLTRFRQITPEQMSKLSFEYYTWTSGDQLWRLADEFYDDFKLWWVIALFNSKPTEAHIKPGDTLIIPKPIDKVMFYLGF